ncbi:serine carboxypeptidase [Microdochium trichocladiopsis]|uniref:Carboxypeptidase n=1 Tax=Microdochium trichocladiopsis TaxID=1682393 RepID=A0A9P9BTS9_9PEZI|nr:serine carboxypeptidase [Microdochium trichocladiopsis]KAH7030769.1 serine carboxypeptidase [Microdochium trichocladiopsis]
MMVPPWGSPRALVTQSLLVFSSWAAVAGAANPVAGDYFVHSLPGAPKDDITKMHAGHIEVNPQHNGNLFFWHVQNKHIANRQRTVIWLNGGPGCSSEDGVMMEIGPYRVKDSNTLEYNNGSWHEFANLLFVDNPVGTGYSYVDTDSFVHELDEMAEQFIIFLEKWFALFPEYEHDDLYISGESYAGQHIPYIAKHILARNKKPATKHAWNLRGLLIGNGWISPVDQYEAYLKFVYDKGLVEKGSAMAGQIESSYRICQKQLAAHGKPEVDSTACESVLQDILRLTQTTDGEGRSQCINMYDVRLKDTYPSCGMNWPPDLKDVTPYLRRQDVVDALHVNSNKVTGWKECSGAVGAAFSPRNSVPSREFLPDLLSEINVLLFSGAEDLICNHYGTESLISNMEWNGGKGFEITPGNWAPRREWTFEGEEAGFWQQARNLTYVLFNNASHMVPFDYPRRSRDMLDRFMGVDIKSIGGTAFESLLDGERLPDTTVEGAANSTSNDQHTKEKEVNEAKWAAYQKSGEVVLALVAIAAGVWGFYVWRARRRAALAGYKNIPGGSAEGGLGRGASGLDNFRNKRSAKDVEAGDFDESELDDLHVGPSGNMNRDHYSVGEDSDDEDPQNEKGKQKASGQRA